MKKFGLITTLEIEPYHENFNELLDLSKQLDYDYEYPLELEIEVMGNYDYQQARTYEVPEFWEPSDFELEVEKVFIGSNEISELLTDDDYIKLYKICEKDIEL